MNIYEKLFTHNLLCIASLLLVFTSFPLLAQTPPADLNGEALKQWLKANYYDGVYTELSYTVAKQRMYMIIDNDNGYLTCVYAGYQMPWDPTNNTTNPDPITCEHIVPQSFYPIESPMRSDIHHLFPTYRPWNVERGDNPFGDVVDADATLWMHLDVPQTDMPTENIDVYCESDGSLFEPREVQKGDIARAIFYFFTMYPTQAGDISIASDLATLYQWHLDDPADAAEITRNDNIELYQGNRNPYVDNAELVQRAWMTANAGPAVPTIAVLNSKTALTISWADVADETGYKIYRSTDNVNFTEVADLATDVVEYVDTDVSILTQYFYYAIAYNTEGNSVISNVVGESLAAPGGGASELFFSEYCDGTQEGDNKMLEIANYTGTTVDLSAYSLKWQEDGIVGTEWSDELILSGEIIDGDVYVICKHNAVSDIQILSDLSTASVTLTFDGNDPIGLFKNGELIDIIGTHDGGTNSDFIRDVTLVRNGSVTAPNAVFDSNEWTAYSQEDFSNLGFHTLGEATDIDESILTSEAEVKVFPNPATDKINIELENIDDREVQINLLDITGKVVYSKIVNEIRGDLNEVILVSNYNKGIYFISIKVDGRLINKKILIQ